jgi:hypothetical protein
LIKKVVREAPVDAISPQAFEVLLPLACAWAEEQEQLILARGVRLIEGQMADALRIGIASPDRVLLMKVEQIPLPQHPELRSVVHELVHVRQHEQLGGCDAFLRKYLGECLTTGYPHAPMEQEAHVIAAKICP